MCYRISTDFSDLDIKNDSQFNITEVLSKFGPRYNVTITQKIPVIIPGSQILDQYKWGLIPIWAKDPTIGQKLGNARSETLTEKPSFRSSFKNKRCLVPVSGFFEWDKNKNPHHIQDSKHKIFALAGLYESWTNPSNPKETINTVTIITCEPNKTIKKLHNRMPVVLNPKDYETWLSTTDLKLAQSLLKPTPDKSIKTTQISKQVNSYKNDTPDILNPINTPKKDQKTLF